MSGYRRSYTADEDRKILRYIFRTNGFYRLRGLQFWKEVEKNELPNRSYHSLHERFRKYIIKNIQNPAYGLSLEEEMKLITIYEETGSGQKATINTASPLPVSSSSTDVQVNLADSDSDGGNSCRNIEEIGSTSNANTSSITLRNEELPSTSKNMSGYRRSYTADEDRKILRYIFRTNGFYRLRGLQFWKEVEKNELPNRSYHSLHERFRKYIIKNIQNPAYGLSLEEEMKLITIYEETGSGQKATINTASPLPVSCSSIDVRGNIARNFFEISDSDSDGENSCRNIGETGSNASTSNNTLGNKELESTVVEDSSSDSEVFNLQGLLD